jgi:hypothetical protein
MDRFPFKLEPNQLGTSHLTAERRLHAIQCKLERDQDLKIKYHKFTKEYEELGHREPVNSQMGRRHVIVKHIIHFLRRQTLQQKLWLCLMETPSLPIAFSITIMSPTYGQTSLYWRGYRVHQTNGRHLWAIELPSFKKKHAIWRRAVSIQSLSNLKRNWTYNTSIIHALVERTVMVITSSQQNTRLHHAGPQLMTASLNERYGISKIKNLVKSVIACYKFKVQPSQQLLDELPSARVQPSRLDLTTGADYAGPVALRLVTIRSKTIPMVILLLLFVLWQRLSTLKSKVSLLKHSLLL